MAQFESQKKSARNLVLSPNKQVAYGGALADAKLTQRQRFDGAAVLDFTPTRRSDKEYAGKGTQFATEGQLTGLDTKFSFKAELDPWLAGFAFAFAMGKEVVTGAQAPYSHAINFDESTTIAPGTTLYLEDTNDVKYKVPDMAVSDLTLTIPERGALQLELGFLGTGLFNMGAMAGQLPAVVSPTYLLGSDCQFELGPAGGDLVAKPARHMTSTFKITTNNKSHVAPGGGMFGHFVRMGIPNLSISSTIAAQANDDIFTLLVNDTLAAMRWTINSGAQSQLIIDVPTSKLKTTKLGLDGSMVVWQIELDDNTMFSNGEVSLMNVTVVNGAVAYLVAA